MRFVCSFAWADLAIQPEERAYVHTLVKKLHLDANERAQVERWLEVPPPADDLDPNSIPKAHKTLFLDAVRGLVAQDGVISDDEAENFELFERLLS
jgi:hypothetical protein